MKSFIRLTDYKKSELLKIFQIADSIPSSMIDDFKDYQISKELMSMANENAILNPCPPFYKGEEVTEDVINSDYFVGYEFKKSLLTIQQAILIYCLST